MSFIASWHTLLDELDDLPERATLITPLADRRFRITDVQDARVIVQFADGAETRPLQRDQFETLYRRIEDSPDGFDLDRLPPDADPYPAVWSVHPRFEIDADAGVITRSRGSTATPVTGGEREPTDADRTEPDGLDVHSDALLLVDALERHDVTTLSELETDALVDIYVLLSDVQRDANDFRTAVADVLLARLHHDRPVSGQYGSVQRTSRRNRSLKDEAVVLDRLENAGVDRERVLSVDRSKVDDALAVTTLSESDVYEVDKNEYVRKAAVDEDVKESRLQGLKDRLAASEDDEATRLRAEIEALERRIDDLTGFRTGAELQG